MSALNFDASTVNPQDSFDPLPPGWYNATITGSETKSTNAGDGSYLSLEFTVLDGEYAGRKVFTNLNLENKNPVAVEIAYKQLSAICHATGVMQVGNSQELHDKPLQVKLNVRKATDQYDASNDVKAFKAVEGGGAAPSAGPANPASAQAAPVATPAPAPAPAGKPTAELVMTAKAQGASYKQFIDQGWTDEMLIAEGYAEAPVTAAPAPAPAPAAAPTPAPAAAPAPATAATGGVPPWAASK